MTWEIGHGVREMGGTSLYMCVPIQLEICVGSFFNPNKRESPYKLS